MFSRKGHAYWLYITTNSYDEQHVQLPCVHNRNPDNNIEVTTSHVESRQKEHSAVIYIYIYIYDSWVLYVASHTGSWHHLFLNFIGVGVTLEVRLHRFVMGENGRREWGKNPRVGYARRRIRIWCWRRGDVGGSAPPLREQLKYR